MLDRIYQSDTSATFWAAGKTVLGGCVDIEATCDVTLVNAFTIPPVISTRDTVTSTRAPTAAFITKPRTDPSEHTQKNNSNYPQLTSTSLSQTLIL